MNGSQLTLWTRVWHAGLLFLLALGVVGLIFLNPWLAAFGLGGAGCGLLIARMIAVKRRNRVKPRTADEPQAQPPETVAPVSLSNEEGRAELIPVFLLAGAVVAVIGALHSGGKPRAPLVRWDAPYRATVVYRPNVFEVDEQFRLSSQLIRQIDKALRKADRAHGRQQGLGVVQALDAGWTVSVKNGDTILERLRDVHHRTIRFWRPHTPLKVRLATPKLRAQTILEPDSSSTVVLTAPKKLLASTDPPAKTIDGGTRTIALATAGSFFPTTTIRVDARSQWARNEPAQRMMSVATWDPFGWIFGALALIVTAIVSLLNDGVKAGLKRFLGLGTPSNTVADAQGAAGQP